MGRDPLTIFPDDLQSFLGINSPFIISETPSESVKEYLQIISIGEFYGQASRLLLNKEVEFAFVGARNMSTSPERGTSRTDQCGILASDALKTLSLSDLDQHSMTGIFSATAHYDQGKKVYFSMVDSLMFWANDEVLLDEMLRNYGNSKATNFSSRWKVKILKGEMVGASFNSGTAFHSNFTFKYSPTQDPSLYIKIPLFPKSVIDLFWRIAWLNLIGRPDLGCLEQADCNLFLESCKTVLLNIYRIRLTIFSLSLSIPTDQIDKSTSDAIGLMILGGLGYLADAHMS